MREQEARFAELVYDYQQTVLEAAREAEDGIVGFLTSQEREAQWRDAVAMMTEAERLCLLEAEQGGRDYNRVYVIQFEKTLQEDDWARSKGDIALNLIRIYRALGGGWQIRLCGPGQMGPDQAMPAPVAGMATAEKAGQAKVANNRPAGKAPVVRTAKGQKAEAVKSVKR